MLKTLGTKTQAKKKMFPVLGSNGPPMAFPKGHGFGSGIRKSVASTMADKDSKLDTALCKVRIEINVFDLPNIPGGKRSFVDFLYLDEHFDVVYLQDAIRNKLRSIECDNVDFEILSNGFVVDDAYFQDILGKALNKKRQLTSTSGSSGGGGLTLLTNSSMNTLSGGGGIQLGSNGEVENWSFDVHIKKKRLTLESLSHLGGSSSGDLRQQAEPQNRRQPPAVVKPSAQQVSALSAHLSDRSAVPLVTISALAGNLQRGKWRLQARVKTVRRKTDMIAECELADMYLQHHVVSLITFRRECIDKLFNLKPNACIQLWNIQCIPKSDRDKQFSTNSHIMKLVFDEGSEVTVIDDPVISGDGQLQAIGLKTFRPHPSGPAGLSAFGTVSSAPSTSNWQSNQIGQPDNDATSTIGGGSSLAATARTGTIGASSLVTSASTSNSMQNKPTRTLLFQTVSTTGLPNTIGGAATPLTPATPAAVAKPVVDARDDYLTFRTETEAFEADRMKKKLRREISDKCFICDLDLEDDEDIEILTRRLKSFRKSVPVPSKETIRALMTDKRTLIPEFEEDRIYCKTTFVNTVTKRLHRVHCRCAHLCSDYQLGRAKLAEVISMAFMNTCALCGEAGACTACGNPECDEMYHTTCAIFSNGYVNFDIRDPYLPRPACPRHTNPNPSTNRSIRLSWIPSNGTEAFDSACVHRHDLRDPDDE